MAYLARDQRRQAIMEAALDFVSKQGFGGLTVRALAKHMGASTGLLHHHFDSLETLKCEALRLASRQEDQRVAALVADLPEDQALSEVLNYDTQAFVSVIRIWMSAAEEANHSATFGKVYMEEQNGFQNWLTDLLRTGQEKGLLTLTLSPERTAWKLMSISFTLGDYLLHQNERLSQEDVQIILKDELDRLKPG